MAQPENSTPTVTGTTTVTTGNEIEYAGVRISLENCLFPQQTIDETPSQKDGLSKSAENDLRRIGCEFIQIAGIMLKVPQVAMASAQVLFQRFFFSKSFVKHKMEEIAMACIWLASKVEECPRRVRDVINVFHYLRLQRNKLPTAPMVLDQDYVNLKNNVIKAERRVLKELGFCVHIKHPHKIIVVYLQVLELEKNRGLVQTAWNYMSDSLQTTVFVQYPPETIACACIYLAARVLQIPLPNRTHWFYLFNATEEDIQKICITLLCVYQTVKTPYELLEKQVEACREVLMEEKLKAKEALGLGDSLAGSAAHSPASRAASPKVSPDKDAKVQSSHRSSTMPTSLEDTKVVANGDKKHRRDDSKNRRSHDLGVKRSRTRSASGTRSSKYRKQSSSSQSSSEDSTPGDKNESRPGRSSDVLPKSYSNQNSNRYSDERRRHRRRKTDGKYRPSKSHRRDEKNEHKTRDGSHKRRESSLKKHKRKLSPDVSSPMPLSHVNGEKTSSASPSSKHRRHRSHRDSIRKKKTRHSASPSHRSRR